MSAPALEFLRRHRVFIVLATAGVAIRVAVMYAYWPAFWFQSDSGAYIDRIYPLQPSASFANGIGYPAFLRILEKTGSLAVVAIVQHLLAVGLATAVYLLLRRRGLPGWLAALGCAPILFDARQIVLEHYILSDSLFTVLVVGAAVFACAFLLPLAAYLAWSKQMTGSAMLSSFSGRYLYSRVAVIADGGFSDLQPDRILRIVIPSATLIAIGTLAVFSGFLASLLGRIEAPAVAAAVAVKPTLDLGVDSKV